MATRAPSKAGSLSTTREWIREAALTHEWDSGLNWTCHCLRHGAAADAARHGGVRAAIAQCGWKSVVAASIYSRPNRLRSTAVGIWVPGLYGVAGLAEMNAEPPTNAEPPRTVGPGEETLDDQRLPYRPARNSSA